MTIKPQSIDSDLAKSLSGKTDLELMGILKNPADWRPEVLDFARSELGRRSIPAAQINQKLAENAAEEIQKRSNEPLSFGQCVFTALCGAVLGLLGLVLVWLQASRYKSAGYVLKSKKIWRLYWFAFGAMLTAWIVLITIAVVTSS